MASRPRKAGVLRLTIAVALFLAALPLWANCMYLMVDQTTVDVTDGDGNLLSRTITEYWGWVCSDCCFDPVWGDPYPPGWQGPPPTPPPDGSGGSPTPTPTPTPTPQPLPGCSVSACLSDCNAHYLKEAGVEVIGDTVLEHYTGVDCGILCMESARMSWEVCQGNCTTDCNLP